MAYDNIIRQNVLDAIDLIERDKIKLINSRDYDVRINGKLYPPKEVMRYANLLANGTKDWPFSGGEPTNKYLKKFGFTIEPKKLNPADVAGFFRNSFSNIWRCADSWGWEELKKTNLLTIAWLNKDIDYKKTDLGSLDRGIRSISPWVNELSIGDLIFVMGKYSFDGICIAESEYDFTGPFLNFTNFGEKPAIKVKYLYKLDNPIEHDLETHNNPATFADIDKYNFGLENIVRFLLEKKPEAINSILSFIDNLDIKKMNTDTLSSIALNTIIYGPPGTGKTYLLNNYRKELFTDVDIPQSSDEVLAERVMAYPFWKVLGAVLGTSDSPLSVGEIISHPIVKAWVNPENKTKPNNLAWADLQSYADDESTQLVNKYRRSIKLFHKSEASKWSVIENKREELADIIDQELLDIAANPNLQPITGKKSRNRFTFITFHQKYSYEDFIEGIKPLLQNSEVEEQGSELQFELKRGIFYKSCLEALKLAGYESFDDCLNDSWENRNTKFGIAKTDTSKQFALFIDEINRANISAVFGELITLLEDDKRMGAENEMWVELPYSNDKFCVPSNLYIIGTMNTADRSIALLDIALRRRFEFKALYPLYTENTWWAPLLQAINQAIYNWKKNPDFFIGHAFFINKLESDKTKIINTKIIPLLYEYCQNNADSVKRILLEAGIQLRPTGIKENFLIIAE